MKCELNPNEKYVLNHLGLYPMGDACESWKLAMTPADRWAAVRRLMRLGRVLRERDASGAWVYYLPGSERAEK